jgi:hypothetical protein
MQVVAMHRGAVLPMRVAHEGAVGQDMFVLVGVQVFPVPVVMMIVAVALEFMRMAANRAIRVRVLMFVSGAFDSGFALAAAAGRAHGSS